MEKVINSNYNNFEEPMKNNLKAVILGGSGAIGRVKFIFIFLIFFYFLGINKRTYEL